MPKDLLPAAATGLPTSFIVDLIVQTAARIAQYERALPCGACTKCQFTTCVKAGAFRFQQLLIAEA